MDNASALLGAIAELLSAIVWPTVAVIVIFRFSREVRRVFQGVARRIENAEKIKVALGAASTELSGIVERSAEVARDTILRVVPPESRTSLGEAEEALMISDSVTNPAERVRAAKGAVAERMRRVLHGLGQSSDGFTLERLAAELRRRGAISVDVETSVGQLSSLADIVQDSGPAAPNRRAADAFISLTEAVLQALPAEP